ncbi:MAG: hypothetical protein M3235_21945 [Actinomycetota bacterium]|nr:hypothetical protein [Actinomycetota bacterium]
MIPAVRAGPPVHGLAYSRPEDGDSGRGSMARYWVGDAGEHGAAADDPPAARQGQPSADAERERLTDAVRRTLAGNVTADDAD